MSVDWMVAEALEGRISCGKSKKGDAPDVVDLRLSGRMLYQLQSYLEDQIKEGGDFFRVRWLVLCHEDSASRLPRRSMERRTCEEA